MAQEQDSGGPSSRVRRPPIPPPGTRPGAPSGVVPVQPLGRGQEPAGARVQEGQPSPDGRYVWQHGEWVPRLPQAPGGAMQPLHLRADRYLRGTESAAEVGFRGFLHRRIGLRSAPRRRSDTNGISSRPRGPRHSGRS